MKLGVKFFLPFLLLAIIIAGSLTYLFFSLTLQGQAFAVSTDRIQKLNSLVEQLNRQQYRTEFSVLSYRFKPDKAYLDTIAQADLEGARIEDEMSVFIASPKGRELAKDFIETKRDLAKTRSELIIAIGENDSENIALNFNKWSLQVQNIRAALADINAFNINSIEGTLLAASQLRNQIGQIIIAFMILFVVVIILLYWFFVSSVIKPIVELSKATEEISRLDFSATTTTTTTTTTTGKARDEVGNLASSFQTMVAKLKEAYAGLEAKVIERTAELDKKVTELESAKQATLNVLEDLNIEKNNLTEAKAKDEALLGSIGDGVFAINPDGTIILFNKAAAEISGYTVAEALGKNYKNILQFSFEDRDEVQDTFIKKALGGVKAEMANHTIITRKDGTKISVADSAAPFVDANNAVLGAVVVFRDVTKEREIDRAKTDFISIAAHQLRTPLSAIKWVIDVLRDGKNLTIKQKERMTNLYISNERLINLVNDLLNVAHIEAGKKTPVKQPTKLDDLIGVSIKLLEPEAERRKQTITLKTSATIHEAALDPKIIGEAINNFLSNAVAYAPESSTIRIAINKVDKNYQVAFNNPGLMISAPERDKIFTKFYRAPEAQKIRPEGSGLGLFIAKSAVESHGGKVWFESSAKAGTTFYFTVPM